MKLQVLEGSKFSIKCLWNTDLSSFGASGMASSLVFMASLTGLISVVVEEGVGKVLFRLLPGVLKWSLLW